METVAIVLGVVGAMLTLAIYAITATRRAGKQEARADVLAVRMEQEMARAKTEALRADSEKGRADALDAAIAEVTAAGPVAGSFDRLVQARKAAGEPRRGDAGEVRDASNPGSAPRTLGPDDLLPPGE